MVSHSKQVARGFVETFPPLRTALKLYDCYLAVWRFICRGLSLTLKAAFKCASKILASIYDGILGLFRSPKYQPLNQHQKNKKNLTEISSHQEPIPYEKQLFKRALTYQGGLILGAVLYIFVYYVLVKRHTFTSIAVATSLLLAYLVILENSHSIRSILMLCLPIMFTNRGRALVFCCMLAIMLTGPLRNTQSNINELHLSLTCCKQFLILKTDKFVDDKVIRNAVKVEEVVMKLVESIKEFARDIEEQFKVLIKLALTVQHYIALCIKKLGDIVNICNAHNSDAYNNCQKTFKDAYIDCKEKLGSTFDVLCKIVEPLDELCYIVKPPDVLCRIPKEIVQFIDSTVGARLRQYMKIVENELYVDVIVDHDYYYNGTKSKSFKQVVGEIGFDVRQKFWYVHFITNAFKLVSLILVCWILITATLYHMHFLTELNYDNIYVDDYLRELDDRRKRRNKGSSSDDRQYNDKSKLINDDDDNDGTSPTTEDDEMKRNLEKEYLFPMSGAHRRHYFTPFSIQMNETERHKLYIAGFVWLIIVGYISMFVALDYSLFKIIELMQEILDDVLFKSDLPIVDISSKVNNQVIRFNRTYIEYLRNKRRKQKETKLTAMQQQSVADVSPTKPPKQKSSIQAMYRKLMSSIEDSVPDDVSTLDSLQQCMPKIHKPDYAQYKSLLYLAVFTMAAVVVEAYAMRARHCIANLYYPKRARQRAVWLYQKLLREKPKYDTINDQVAETPKSVKNAVFIATEIAKRRR